MKDVGSGIAWGFFFLGCMLAFRGCQISQLERPLIGCHGVYIETDCKGK